MEFFTKLCMFVLFSGLGVQTATHFFADSSPRQLKKLEYALRRIYVYIDDNTKYGHPPIEYKFTYRNKNFAIGVLKEKVDRYTKFRVFINGDEAGCLHELYGFASYKYYFESLNNKPEDEVRDIVIAAFKQLDKQQTEAIMKKVSTANNSYFK